MLTCECGAELAGSGTGELCPACLLRLGLEFPVEEVGAQPSALPRLVTPIGRGELGTTYLGMQEGRLPAFVAVKLIEVTIDVDRFLEASRRTERLLALHPVPGIAPPLACGATEDGRAFVLTPYLHGRNLLAQVVGDAPAAIGLAAEICRIVSGLHERGIAHGALKPANVLVSAGAARSPILLGVATAVAYARPRTVSEADPRPASENDLRERDVRALEKLVDLCLARLELAVWGRAARRLLSFGRSASASELARELAALRL